MAAQAGSSNMSTLIRMLAALIHFSVVQRIKFTALSLFLKAHELRVDTTTVLNAPAPTLSPTCVICSSPGKGQARSCSLLICVLMRGVVDATATFSW